MKKTTILFDLDGTLIDSTEAILESFDYAFKKINLSTPSKEKILSLIGHPLDFMFFHLGIKKDIEKFVKAYKENYRVISKFKTKLLPYAKDSIEYAHSFAKLGVVTTKTGLYSKELLEYFEVSKFFDVVIGREDVINPKPHPEPILKAMHFMNSLKEHTWMIGDTCLDIESANAADIKSIALTCGYGSLNELKRCAIHIKNDSFEAVKFVKKCEKN
ncbi:HAD family hydrolase [Nitrosophilus kaiyonis]|uniref:HAD family hydrolase n=1 Tax=Nitrosophilus kaiyonis TaxID=2930200 RepID=UPI00249059DE|nr:HAD family hydrolase [Nitrosophilus kaiyonis]